MGTMTDTELITAIQAGGTARERATAHLYRQCEGFVYEKVAGLYLEPEQRREAYHLALAKGLAAIAEGQLRSQASVGAYLYQIYRRTCVDMQRAATSMKQQVWQARVDELPDYVARFIPQPDLPDLMQKLERVMDQLGKNCKELILQTEYWGYSLQEVAAQLGYKSVGSATTTKSRCMDKLRQALGIPQPNQPSS